MPFNVKEAPLGDLVREMCFLAVSHPYVLKTKELDKVSKRQKDYYKAFHDIAEEINTRELNYKLSEREREAIDANMRIG